MDFLRDNGCVVDFNRGTLHAGDTQVKLKDEPSWEVHRVSLLDTVTIQPDQKVDLVCEVKGQIWREFREFSILWIDFFQSRCPVLYP